MVDTDLPAAPVREFGRVLMDVRRRVLYLHQLHRRVARIMLCRIDVKSAFRQVLVDPKRAAAFRCVVGDYPAMDLSLQFGWRLGPYIGGLGACA